MNGYQPKKSKKPKPPKHGSRVHPSDSVSDKLRIMANQGVQSVEAVVKRPETSSHLDGLYYEFVAWMKYKNINADEFNYLYKRYYDEFIGGL